MGGALQPEAHLPSPLSTFSVHTVCSHLLQSEERVGREGGGGRRDLHGLVQHRTPSRERASCPCCHALLLHASYAAMFGSVVRCLVQPRLVWRRRLEADHRRVLQQAHRLPAAPDLPSEEGVDRGCEWRGVDMDAASRSTLAWILKRCTH